MKKLFGFLAIAMNFAFTSCSTYYDYEDDDQQKLMEILAKLHDNVSVYGKKSTSMTVYAGGIDVSAVTRGCDVNGNMWPSVPVLPTTEEVNGVLAYIAANPDANVNAPDYTYYYIQHVGGAHKRYSYTDMNGVLHENELDGTQSLERLCVLENDGNWIHVNNFNAGTCNNVATGNAVLMTNGFNGATCLDENGSTVVTYWRIYYWNDNYYLAIDYSRDREDGKVEPDGIYDDWVVKIIPASGETPNTPDGPSVDPDDTTKVGEVEFDIHQQVHESWHEIKTSVHVRDTADVRIFLPIPAEYQAVADDFDIRIGDEYSYVENLSNTRFYIGGVEYTVPVEINHKANGIEILIAAAECKEALKAARGIYDDGLTFEIHSYVYHEVTNEQVWNWLQTIKDPETSLNRWPSDGECITHTYGQVTSGYFTDSRKDYVKDPQ